MLFLKEKVNYHLPLQWVFQGFQQTRLQTQYIYFKSKYATVKPIQQVARARIERGLPDNSNGKTCDGAGSENIKKQ